METRRAGKEAMRQTRRANLSMKITSSKGTQSPGGTLHQIKRLKTPKMTENPKVFSVSSKYTNGPDDWAENRKSLPAVSMDTKLQGTKPVDSKSKSPGIRTRLSTGSIHMNGTTTISTAKERAEQEHIMKQIEKDTTRPPVTLLKKRNSSSGSGDSMMTDHPPPKKRKIGRNDGSGEDNRNDYYCWLCHKEGTVVCCELCPRVYHTKCLELAGELPHDWVCPECEKIMRAECTDTRSKSMEMLTLDQLCTLLMYALERMQHAGSEPFQTPVDVALVPIYSDYIFNAMDLETLEKNIKKRLYGSTESFMSDTKWILHNCIIFNGAHNKLTGSGKMIVKICKHEMNEIELCPDCYLNSCIRRNDEWFSELCRTPHTLVWAKLKGYPFWPAKALREEDGQVDVRFFGAHDRSWVPVSQCFLLSKNIPTSLQKGKKNAGLDGAIDELNKHVNKLREKFGHFEYAPFRTPYDKTDSYKPVNIKPPGNVASPSKSHGPVVLPYKNHSSLLKRAKLSCKTAAAVRSKYNAIVHIKKVDTALARISGTLSVNKSEKAVESTDSVTDKTDVKVNTEKIDTDVTDGLSDNKMSSVTWVTSNVKKSFVSMSIVEKLEQKIQKMNEKETVERGDICDIKTSDTQPALINETEEIEESFHEDESPKSSVSNTECNMKDNHEPNVETSDLKNNTDEELASRVSLGTSNDTSKSNQAVLDMDKTVSKLNQRLSETHKTSSELNKSVSCDILSEGSKVVQNDDNEKPNLLTNLTTDKICVSEYEKVKNIIQNDNEKKGSQNGIKESQNDMAQIPDSKMEAPHKNKESQIEKEESQIEEVSRNFESDLCNQKLNSHTFPNVTDPTSTPTEKTDKTENNMLIDNNTKCAEDIQKTKDMDVEDRTALVDDNEIRVKKDSDGHEDMIVEENSKLDPDKTSDDIKNHNQANDEHDDIYILNEKLGVHIRVIDSEKRNAADSKTQSTKDSSLSEHVMDVGEEGNCVDKFEAQTVKDSSLTGHAMDMSDAQTINDSSLTGHTMDMSEEAQTVKNSSLTGHTMDMSEEAQTVKDSSLTGHTMDMSEVQAVKDSSLTGHKVDIGHSEEDSDVDRLVIDLDSDKDSPNKFSVKGGEVKNGASFTHGTSPLIKPLIVLLKPDVSKTASNQNEHCSYDKKIKNARSIISKKENVSAKKTPQIKDTGKSSQRLEERENVINKDDSKNDQQTKKIVIEVPSSVSVIDLVKDHSQVLQKSSTSSSSYVSEENPPNVIDSDRLMDNSNMVAVNTGELQSHSKTPQEISDRFMKKILNSIQTNVDEMLGEFQQTRPVQTNDDQCQETEVVKWNCKNEILELKHNFELTVSELKSSWCAQREQLMKTMTNKHQEEMERTLTEAKKKQWCANCPKEAIFYCCWNTSYCNYPCQQAHWPTHALTCMQTNKQQTSNSADKDDSSDGTVQKSLPSETVLGTSGNQTLNQLVTSSSNTITSASFRHLPDTLASAIRREEEKRGEARGHMNQKFLPAPMMQNIHPLRLATNSSNMMNQVPGSVFLNQGMPAVPLTQQAVTNNMILQQQQPILQQTMYPVQRQQQPFSNTILFPPVNNSQPSLLGYNTRHPF